MEQQRHVPLHRPRRPARASIPRGQQARGIGPGRTPRRNTARRRRQQAIRPQHTWQRRMFFLPLLLGLLLGSILLVGLGTPGQAQASMDASPLHPAGPLQRGNGPQAPLAHPPTPTPTSVPVTPTPTPTAPPGYVGDYLACGTPLQMGTQDFGWGKPSIYSPEYRGDEPTLCDTKWPTRWSLKVCLHVSEVLKRLGWPDDLLLPQYRNMIACNRIRQPAPPPQTSGNPCVIGAFLGFGGINVCQIWNNLVVAPINQAVHWFDQQGALFLWRTSPDATYNNKGLRQFWQFSWGIVGLLLVAAIMWAGIRVMAGASGWLSYARLMEILPRLVFALLAAACSLKFAQLWIDGNNALCDAFADRRLLGLMDAHVSGFAQFLQAIYDIMFLLFSLEAFFRMAVLAVLIGFGPLLMFAWALPETEPVARIGTQAIIWISLLQAMQIGIYTLGGKLLSILVTDPGNQLSLVSVGTGIGVSYLAFILPGWIRYLVFGGPAGRLPGWHELRSLFA